MKSRSLILFAAMVLLAALAIPIQTSAQTATSSVTSSNLGQFSPTFVGSAATGCAATGCSLLTGPFFSPSTESLPAVAKPLTESAIPSRPHVMPWHGRPRPAGVPLLDPTPPTVSCEPLGPGCDAISSSSDGAMGVKGLNAVDSGTLSTNLAVGDIEPADQGLCAGNGYVVETNNIGEVLIFNSALQRQSAAIPLDTIMGLTSRGWSSGGDVSCLYDYDNGGHWFFTQFVSASTEANGGPFAGCFAALANTCYEGIAVTVGSNPFGPYNVYFFNADYNPSEPGYPYLLNDFAKIATSKDAFLLFYDEFPQRGGGLGGGFFNGAQQLAFSKDAFEEGLAATDKKFTVAIENMGLLPTPDGTCSSTDNPFNSPGVTCWYQVIPAQPPDPSEYYSPRGGSAFMLGSLDFFGNADDRIAVFNWTGLSKLHSANCNGCAGIQFGAQLLSGVKLYYGEGFLAGQKSGPIPLGDECGAAGWSVGSPPPASCPEGGIATNGDGFTQVSQAQGHLWGALSTEINQTYSSGPSPEVHQGALYFAIDFSNFNSSGVYSLTGQEYVSPRHEDLEFPAMAAGGNGGAIITFTLSGNGGPTGADSGGFYPSTAYGRLSSTSDGLSGSVINIADLGESPQDGFTEYDGYPGPTRPRWGDYSWAIYSGGRVYFSTNYIQYPNCVGSAFTLTIPTCGGTRDGNANWGTSVNFVVP
ncbi:MAG: hypothetical protein WCA38_06420 [Candidatus Acidiferrales bacterium]